MLNFWDTVRGHNLADTLIRCLPEIAHPNKQSVVKLDHPDVAKKVYEGIEKGEIDYCGSFEDPDGCTVLIVRSRN